MIHLSLAIHCAESSSASPTFSILTGSASEALPDTPGQVEVTLSETYNPPKGYEVRYRVSDHAGGDPGTASPIAPGETQLTDTAFTGTAYVKLYLVRASDGAVVQQTELPAVDLAEASTGPRLTNAFASANGAAARGSVATDEGNGVLYWIATADAEAPNASDVIAGRTHAGTAAARFGSVPVEAEGPVKIAVSGLMPGETYYLHFAQRSSDGYLSAVASSAAVTLIPTVIEDLTNPTVEDIFAGNPLRTAWEGVTADDYAADNAASVTGVNVTYRIGGKTVENGEVSGAAGDVLTIAVDVTASDGTQARFLYGPATIVAAPVVDKTGPTLSRFALTVSGPGVIRGAVMTDEAGGALQWVGTEDLSASVESEILSKLEMGDAPATGLMGTIPVFDSGIVPVEFADLHPDTNYAFYCCHTDAAGNRSNLVKASARTLSSENLTITIEDFSRDRVPYHSVKVAETGTSPSEGVLSKEGVLSLRDDPLIGSQHKGPYKIPGEDRLPDGIAISGKLINIDKNFTGWLEGWDFTGYTLTWRSGEVRLRHNILGEKDGPAGLHFYLDIYASTRVVGIVNNDFIGPNSYGGAGTAIKYRWSGAGAAATGPDMAPGRVAENSFFGLSSDAIKPTGGIIEKNVLVWDRNIDGPAYAWIRDKTYGKGEYSRNDKGQLFQSKSDGNTGNSPPGYMTDTPHWKNVDPHVDAINPAVVSHELTIRNNYVDMRGDPARSDGFNNVVRLVPNSNHANEPHLSVEIHGNIFYGPTYGHNKLVQSTSNGNTNYEPDRIHNNWFLARDDDQVIHQSQSDGVVWTENRNLETGKLIPKLSNMVDNPGLVETPAASTASTAAYLASVSRSGIATPGYVVEARAVPRDGGEPTAWTEIAIADETGHWSGALDVPRSASPYQFEVRLKDAAYMSAETSRSFVSGVVVAVHAQSDIASPAMRDRSPWVEIDPEPLLKDDLVQMFYLDGFEMDAPEQPASNLRRVFLSNETPYSPGMAAIANTFIDLMPETPVALIMHAVSGTSPLQMAKDGWDRRVWENDKKLHDFATRDGNQVGLHANFFSSSLSSIGRFYHAAAAPIFTGKTFEGRVFDPATDNPHEYTPWGSSVHIDHTYTDLYDPSFTKTMILPIEAIEEEDSVYRLVEAFPSLVPGKFDLYNSSVSGRYNASRNRMDDTNHANSHKEWGGPRRMRMWALSMIEALGEVPLEQPVLDIVEAAPNGDEGMVRIGSSSGPISTLRKQLDLPELDSSKYPAYGDVYGIFVNDTYVDAYIGDDAGKPADHGWIYVPKPRGDFGNSDVIGTRSLGFGRDRVNGPSWGTPSSVDYYLDDGILSKPVVPHNGHRIWGLHAIMPREAGDIFSYSEIVSGKWSGSVPPLQEGGSERPEPEEPAEEERKPAPEPSEPPQTGGIYEADFSTDLSTSALFTTSSGAILRHKPDATQRFPNNGSLTGALELTGEKFWDTHFSFVPNVSLSQNQSFEVDLAAYASSLPDQTSTMSIELFCDYEGGSELLSEIYPSRGTSVGDILADIKGQRFSCRGKNGKPRIEFFIDNPREDKRRISLMRLAVRSL